MGAQRFATINSQLGRYLSSSESRHRLVDPEVQDLRSLTLNCDGDSNDTEVNVIASAACAPALASFMSDI